MQSHFCTRRPRGSRGELGRCGERVLLDQRVAELCLEPVARSSCSLVHEVTDPLAQRLSWQRIVRDLAINLDGSRAHRTGPPPRYARTMSEIDFEQDVEDALASLPRELGDVISNVAIVVEEEPPPGLPLLGLYQGIPLTRRGTGYSGVPAGQDHDLPRPARAPLRRRPRKSASSDPARGAARGRAPFRDQRRAPRRARPLLTQRAGPAAPAPLRSLRGFPQA